MIAELAQDLMSKISTVTQLGGRIGMVAAGGMTDPSMKTVPMPACWVMFESDSPTYLVPDMADTDILFSVALMVSYTDQLDLINNQIPTIEAIARSVSGKESTQSSIRWQYQGAQLVDVFTDRLVYELKFMASASYMI
jgi:hypothetical protein